MFDNIGTLDSLFADPDMEALRQKLNEMILSDTPRTFPIHPSDTKLLTNLTICECS